MTDDDDRHDRPWIPRSKATESSVLRLGGLESSAVTLHRRPWPAGCSRDLHARAGAARRPGNAVLLHRGRGSHVSLGRSTNREDRRFCPTRGCASCRRTERFSARDVPAHRPRRLAASDAVSLMARLDAAPRRASTAARRRARRSAPRRSHASSRDNSILRPQHRPPLEPQHAALRRSAPFRTISRSSPEPTGPRGSVRRKRERDVTRAG
jgi:hypothetical protein